MSEELKTEKINLRIQPSLKERLDVYASKNRWSINQAACVVFDLNLPKLELTDNVG